MSIETCLKTACNKAQKSALDAQTARDSLPVELSTADVMVLRDDIGDAQDLDLYTDIGIYRQLSDAFATNGFNYPVGLAGELKVDKDIQTYTTYATKDIYIRSIGESWIHTDVYKTDIDVKSAYEANTNTNAFDDVSKVKLDGIENFATADQTNTEIKIAYESNADTNAYTDIDKVVADTRTLNQKVDIGDSVDLDSIVTTGLYHQNANTYAINGINYPIALAGMLEVKEDGSMVYQEYRDYLNKGVHTRVQYSGVWTVWGVSTSDESNQYVASDTAKEFRFRKGGGSISVICYAYSDYPQVSNYSALIMGDFGLTPTASVIYAGVAVDVVTDINIVPTGTTGVPGRVTIYLGGSSKSIYVENRAAGYDFNVTVN